MRAVSLSDKVVQEKVEKSFVPLKVKITFGDEKFPLDWLALKIWQDTYARMGGPKTTGITACAVVSPDLKTEYGSTGSAFVWEMFDSIAYDASKFSTMLDRAAERGGREKAIRADKGLDDEERDAKLASFRAEVRRAVGEEGRFRLPPRGFTIQGAVELFELSGDLKEKGAKQRGERAGPGGAGPLFRRQKPSMSAEHLDVLVVGAGISGIAAG